MELRRLKQWIDSLPENYLDYEVVNATIINESNEDFSVRVDNIVSVLSIDEETKEILIMNNDIKTE